MSRVAGTGTGDCGSFPGFNLTVDNPNPHGKTPQQALDAFISSGSIFGATPPIINPTRVGYPSAGWKQVQLTSKTATFQSGKDQFYFAKSGEDSWVIIGGQKTC